MKRLLLSFLIPLLLLANPPAPGHAPSPAAARSLTAQQAADPPLVWIHTTQADWMSGERDHLDVRTLDALGTPYRFDHDIRGAMRLRSRPGPWSEHPANPIVVPGEAGEWDDAVISEAKVIYDGKTYHMWYAGRWRHPEGLKTPMDLGYATSSDGVHWEKYHANPVLKRGPLGGYDENIVSAPAILYDSQRFHMWFSAVDFDGDWSINYATSFDGVKWTKSDANPLLTESHDHRWDAVYLAEPFVLYNGTEFQMWYNGASAQTNTLLGYATSPDGIEWTRFAENRPVLSVAADGAWDDFAVARASVMFDGERYQMWYEGHSGGTWRIGYATSPDGVEWQRGPDNPIVELGEQGTWDSQVASEPNVIFDGQTYRMYHSGYDGDRYRVGLVTAPAVYDERGVFGSPPVGGNTPVTWGMLACDLSLPAQTGVTFEVATGNDGETWSEWIDAASLQATKPFSGVHEIDLYDLDLPDSRFLRYRATLTTSDPAVSPLIREIAVSEAVPDFKMTLLQDQISLHPGQRAEVTVSLQARHGFTSPVHLSVKNLPDSIAATWSPGFIMPPGSTTLNLEAEADALPGTMTLTLEATDSGLAHEIALSLTLLEPLSTARPTPSPLPSATFTPPPARGATPTPAPPPPPPQADHTGLWLGGSITAAGSLLLLAWVLALILLHPPEAAEGEQAPQRWWHRRWWRHWAWAIVMILIAAAGITFTWQQQDKQRQAAAEYQTLIDGWPTGQDAPAPWLGEAQIREAVEARIERPYLRPLTITALDQTALLDVTDLGFQSNVDEFVAWALAANETNSGQVALEAFLNSGQIEGESPAFSYTIDDALLRAFVQDMAQEIERPLVKPVIDETDLIVSAGQAGITLPVEAAVLKMKAAIQDPAINRVDLDVTIVEPERIDLDVTIAHIASAWNEPPVPAAMVPVTIPFDSERWLGGEAKPEDWTPTRPMTGYTFLPGRMGWTLDITTAKQIVQDTLRSDAQDVSFKAIVDVAPAPLTLEDIEPALLEIAGHFDGFVGLYVQDLTTGQEIRHNSYVTTSGMSMIKVAIMATAYRTLPQPFPAELQDAIAQMIAHSINEKSNYVILQIGEGDFATGLARINETLSALDMRQTYIRSAYRTEKGPFYDPIDVPERPAADIPPAERIDLWPDTAMQTSLSDQASLFQALYAGSQGGGKLLAAFPNLTAADCQAMLELLRTNPTRTFLGPGFDDQIPMAHKNGFGGGGYTDERMNVGVIWPPGGRPYLVGLYQWDKIEWIHWLRVWPQQIELSRTLYNYFTMPEPLPPPRQP
ncbi:MAG: serine hydrolase [Anaerolineae bacterium]|nr:serine hydrolase [Anaerolineae bacterium]